MMEPESPNAVRLLMAERERLFSYIWSIVGDNHLAEDVFQEVSLLVIQKHPEASDDLRFRVWLRHTARYKAIEALRRVKKVVPLDESVIEKLEENWIRYDSTSESDLVSFLRYSIADS
jgi:RNA polymerase sigma-70 factor (ECF subfamily)